eukprot:5029974-Ditylum_brightwellii.AAC.1
MKLVGKTLCVENANVNPSATNVIGDIVMHPNNSDTNLEDRNDHVENMISNESSLSKERKSLLQDL